MSGSGTSSSSTPKPLDSSLPSPDLLSSVLTASNGVFDTIRGWIYSAADMAGWRGSWVALISMLAGGEPWRLGSAEAPSGSLDVLIPEPLECPVEIQRGRISHYSRFDSDL
jgi:hypothetical protein